MPSLLDTLLARSQAGDPEAIALLASLQGSGGALTAGASPEVPPAAPAAQGDPQTQALIAGMPGLGGGPGSLESLRKPIVDPDTGRSDIPTGPTGEIVRRSMVLPLGVNDRGEIRPAAQSLIRDAPDMLVNAARQNASRIGYAGDIASGRKNLWDPQTGSVSDEALQWSTKQAAGMLGAAMPMPVPGAGVVLGSGPVRRGAVENLGLGRGAMPGGLQAAGYGSQSLEQALTRGTSSDLALDMERRRLQAEMARRGFGGSETALYGGAGGPVSLIDLLSQGGVSAPSEQGLLDR